MRFYFLLLSLLPLSLVAQIGIGTSSVNGSAQLQVDATNKGFLPPRVALTSATDVATIASPATGLLVYNTSTLGTAPNNVIPGFYYYDGNKWQRLINQQPDATIEFDTDDPNVTTPTPPTFTPNTPADKNYIYVSSTDGSQWTWNGTAYVTYVAPANTAWYLVNSLNDAGGNKSNNIYRTGAIGIGTSSPGAMLEIGKPDGSIPGSMILNPTTTSAQSGGQEGGEIVIKASVDQSPVAGDWVIDQVADLDNPRFRIFRGNGAGSTGESNTGITIRENGNVGIGTASPDYKLQVSGTIQVNGDVRYSGNLVSSSDLRLKDIAEKWNSEDGINTLKYTWKDGRDDRNHIGYGAQEVEAVLPHAVYTDQNSGLKSVNYSEVHTYKLQSQEDMIRRLQTQLNSQEQEIEDLKKKLESLHQLVKRKRKIKG